MPVPRSPHVRGPVFGRAISTNNDVEGWHRRLNERAKNGQANLYVLIALLHGEGQLVSIHAQLVSERKLKWHQRHTYLRYQARLFSLWAEYQASNRTADQLLAACAKVHDPCRNFVVLCVTVTYTMKSST